MAGTGEAIIDVNGVGYLLQCGSRTLGGMGVGDTVCMHVETHVREQAITLYGFHSEEERAWFVRLQSVHRSTRAADALQPGNAIPVSTAAQQSTCVHNQGRPAIAPTDPATTLPVPAMDQRTRPRSPHRTPPHCAIEFYKPN